MELRKDPITGRQVAFAPERASRPFEHTEPPPATSLDRCPFCRGNEDLTPEAVLQPGESGEASREWLVRVIPNRYPAFAARQ
jgi:UDPglucose--hexose-1-phosphate uridylyltransferase